MLHIFCFLLFLNNRDFNIVVTVTCFSFSVISTFSSWSSSYFVWRLIRTNLLAPINNSDQHWSLGDSRDAKTQTGCPRVSWPGMAARKPARVTLVFRSLTTWADVSKRSQQLKLKKKNIQVQEKWKVCNQTTDSLSFSQWHVSVLAWLDVTWTRS